MEMPAALSAFFQAACRGTSVFTLYIKIHVPIGCANGSKIKRKYAETWESRKNEGKRVRGEIGKFDEKIRIESETKIFELM